MGKLKLNDSAFVYSTETSMALGFGFRCGFLGLLHLEIVQERLRREYDMDIIATYPSVVYKIYLSDGTMKEVDNPAFMPDVTYIAKIEEPMVKAFVICPNENIGDMMALISEKRGNVDHTETLDSRRVMLTGLIPLNEILIDFHDRIKSITRGFGSMDYEPEDYLESDMVKLDMLVNTRADGRIFLHCASQQSGGQGPLPGGQAEGSDPPPAVPDDNPGGHRRKNHRLRNGQRFRKDVTAKCYGGDVSRKRKLLEKQKEGKKRMKSIGNVNIPQEAFIEVLKA